MQMKIRGKYERDENFTVVYADNRIYTIARNTGDWNSIGVGDKNASGQILDQGTYDKLAGACCHEGTFVLS